jgi:transglutaminase-like putative cysteine protease
MRFDIRNRTVFSYTGQVVESQNELRACPLTDDCQRLLDYRVTVAPAARVFSHVDYWGTRVDSFGIRRPHTTMEVVAEASVETRPRPLPTAAPRFEALARPDFVDAHIEYLQTDSHTDFGEGVSAAAERQRELAGPDVVGVVLSVHRFVGATLAYQVGATEVGTPVEDVLAGGAGVCQDYAHLAVAMCRSLGIPARYVSGYLFTDDDAVGLDARSDAVMVQTHAWFEAAVPGWGWLALDPTNGQLVGERHVTIGHGRSYDDVQPQRGVFLGPADSRVQPAVEIRRVSGGELWRPAPGLHLDEPLAGGGVFPAAPVALTHGPADGRSPARAAQQQQQQQ